MSFLEFLPFKENIGNQVFYDGDTVRCLSLMNIYYDGFLKEVGLSSHLKIVKNAKQYEFMYEKVNPVRIVLMEKINISHTAKINTFHYEYNSHGIRMQMENLQVKDILYGSE